MQSEQQQQQEDAMAARQEEYLMARRAGAEAVLIGQETLEEAMRQGEQLENAEKMADETGYQLDKAGRILRGMTWSGWVANMFSKELTTPDATKKEEESHVPAFYEDTPAECRDAAQAVQNYNANLKILTTCETDEQLETAKIICENMYQVAKKEVDKLVELQIDGGLPEENNYFVMKLQKDLSGLRSRQEIKRRFQERQAREQRNQERQQQAYQNSREVLKLSDDPNGKDVSYRAVELPGLDDASPETREILKMQDEHLDGMAQHLDELGNIAINLSEATEKQAALVEVLDGKSDSILDKSRMVTRRSDRLIQAKAWTPAKPVFDKFVYIQHVPTQKFLAVTNGTLILQSTLDYETCVFGVHKRQGSIFGLQSRYNRRWVGQNILGNLECRASSFGRRQEWETEKQWEKGTPLLCASAGWGAGSYVVVRGGTVNIATTGSITGRQADQWILKEAN